MNTSNLSLTTAANNLHDADARLRAIIADDADFWHGRGGRRAADGEIAAAQSARDAAQEAYDTVSLAVSEAEAFDRQEREREAREDEEPVSRSRALRASGDGLTVVDAFGRMNALAPMRSDALCARLTQRAAFYRMAVPEIVRSPRGLRPRSIVRALRRDHAAFAQVVVASELNVVL